MLRRHLPTLTLCVFFLTTLSACQAKQPEPPKELVKVDNRSISLAQFQQDFEKSLPTDQHLSPAERRDLERSFLVQVIDRQLAVASALRQGLSVTPEEIETALAEHRRDYPEGSFEQMLGERGTSLEQWRQELQERLLMEKVARQSVYSKVKVSDAELAEYYRNNRQDFNRPAQVRARQIVVANEEEGQRVLGLLRTGETFIDVAKQHSLSPDADQGGDLGFFAPGEMPPEFDAAVFGLPVGRLSNLVHTEYGYHIFLVEEKRKAMQLTLDQVRDEIAAQLRAEKEEVAYQAWLQELRAKANIEVNWSLL